MNEVKTLIYRKFRSEAALATKLGWSRQKLNKYTTGRSMMDIKALWELSQALETDMNELMAALLAVSARRREQKRQGG